MSRADLPDDALHFSVFGIFPERVEVDTAKQLRRIFCILFASSHLITYAPRSRTRLL